MAVAEEEQEAAAAGGQEEEEVKEVTAPPGMTGRAAAAAAGVQSVATVGLGQQEAETVEIQITAQQVMVGQVLWSLLGG